MWCSPKCRAHAPSCFAFRALASSQDISSENSKCSSSWGKPSRFPFPARSWSDAGRARRFRLASLGTRSCRENACGPSCYSKYDRHPSREFNANSDAFLRGCIPSRPPGNAEQAGPDGALDTVTVLWERVQSSVFPRLASTARGYVAGLFERFVEQQERAGLAARLIHQDLRAGNILYEREQGCLTGIIDFTYSSAGDSAYDIATLGRCYGSEFMQGVLTHYQTDECVESMLARVDFHRKVASVRAIADGVETQQQASVDYGLELLSEQMRVDLTN